MKLIGMLDSPYVRRVAVSLQLLGLPFEHESVSVFRQFDAFARVNPVVKAPTLVTDDGTVLMDSTLILEYAEALAAPRSLMPASVDTLPLALHRIGLALAACEKCVQIVYEHGVRPAEKRHDPWLDRVTGQLNAAFELLERSYAERPVDLGRDAPDQAAVSTAVAWTFTQALHPERAEASRYPRLVALTRQAETLPAFMRAPHGDGIVARG